MGHDTSIGTVASSLSTLALPAFSVGLVAARSPDIVLIWLATVSPVTEPPVPEISATDGANFCARQPSRKPLTAASGPGRPVHDTRVVAVRAAAAKASTNRGVLPMRCTSGTDSGPRSATPAAPVRRGDVRN